MQSELEILLALRLSVKRGGNAVWNSYGILEGQSEPG